MSTEVFYITPKPFSSEIKAITAKEKLIFEM